MKIKVDEDLPNKAIQLLKEQGYHAVNVIEQEMGGFKDVDLWPIVQAEQRFLITADKGFPIYAYTLRELIVEFYFFDRTRMVLGQFLVC